MEFLAAALSTLVSVFLFALFIAGVLKLFQIHATLVEIKDALRRPSVPTALTGVKSGDEMLRELDAEIREEELRSASPH